MVMKSTNEALLGRDMFGDEIKPDVKGELRKRYFIPPFSVLSARDGSWQERKRQWINIGIKSEVGRGENLLLEGEEITTENLNYYRNRKNKLAPGGSPRPAMDYSKGERGDGRGQAMPQVEETVVNGLTFKATGFMANIIEERGGGTSIFDPVLTELMYMWFCPEGGQIVDPFAGGSVRGIVASVMGYKYWGCDLSEKQIAANYEQARSIVPENVPEWQVGDSDVKLAEAPDCDFIFSCPPYGDLEVYSDDPADLSNMDFKDMVISYKSIIRKACDKLKPNSYACFVVGDYRDKDGNYRCFPLITTRAFLDAGLKLYNEIILVTAVGSLPVRITKQFEAGRKVGKTHQNVLVFKKYADKRQMAL